MVLGPVGLLDSLEILKVIIFKFFMKSDPISDATYGLNFFIE